MLKNVSFFATMLLLLVGISGCMAVASPVLGLFYTEAKYGDTATPVAAANKEGKACATSILGLIAMGDASVEAAKTNGGIREVSSVDHSAKNILGLFGEWCTIVRGR